MSTSDTNLDARGRFLFWVGLLVLLYVLSIGPVVKLAIAERIPAQASQTIYAPLVWLYDKPLGEKFVRLALIWYGETIWRWELPLK